MVSGPIDDAEFLPVRQESQATNASQRAIAPIFGVVTDRVILIGGFLLGVGLGVPVAISTLIMIGQGIVQSVRSPSEETAKAVETETLHNLQSVGPMESLTSDQREALVEGVEEFCDSVGANETLKPGTTYDPQTNSLSEELIGTKTPDIERLTMVVQESINSTHHIFHPTEASYFEAIKRLNNRVKVVKKAEGPRH